MRFARLLTLFSLPLAAGALLAQPPAADREQPRYTATDYERQAERVITRDLAAKRNKVPPLTTRSLRQAVEAVAAGGSTLPADLGVAWAELVSAEGFDFVGLEASVAADQGFAAGAKVVLFGAFTDGKGAEAFSFEVKRTLAASTDRLYADVPLYLDPGEYRAVIGIADGKTPKRTASLLVAPVAIEAGAFGLSRLLLSDHLFPLAKAQEPDEPFAFGGIKVVPRGDSTFPSKSEAWLFVVVRQPGLTAGEPKLGARVTLEGPAEAGATVRRVPVGTPVPTALQGFPGQWGLGFAISLAPYPAGTYRATLEVTDGVKQETRAASAELRIVR